MGGFIKFGTARKCPIHNAVALEAAAMLEASGYFAKQSVVDNLNYAAVEESIRWDYIRRMIDEDWKQEISPITLAGIREAKRGGELTGRHIAGGNGRKTYGYASIVEKNHKLVIARIQNKMAIARGVANGAGEYAQKAESKDIHGVLDSLPSIGRAFIEDSQRIGEQQKTQKRIEDQSNDSGTTNTESSEDGTYHAN